MKNRLKQQNMDYGRILLQWLPAIVACLLVFIVPPIAIAVILAYFTAPFLHAIRAIFKLPLSLSTLIVMLVFLFLFSTFTLMTLHGLMDTVPTIERHILPFTGNADLSGKVFSFMEEKVVQYGQSLLEHAVSFLTKLFQQIFNLFLFLVAYFFALRESGRNRFWFLLYFPVSMRSAAKRVFMKSGELIGTFLFVEARLFLATYITLSIGFSLLRFEAPLGSAFLVSLIDSLPFLGIGLFLLPMAAFFIYTDQLTVGISLLVLYVFILVTRQMLESYFYASSFRLKPIHAFIVTACSVYLFGLPGILLTPFLLFAALKVKEHPLFNG
ncbi:hypothetical protein NCCP2222_05280 [Sporosarcina sp. NCCP-2222]|uniref:AI-2E family transporter n=1 Tax=Sporosarcina sp. NCCP-2222 TaxID=2935073 RepID=UPI00207EA861|nr:AI-2E family transporter [Sporosarcina sp. NCCP-2222]GKV54581.1 hypothetical protein NCCP2222_05280 [Sporosarcina sp. NCCP-2222]